LARHCAEADLAEKAATLAATMRSSAARSSASGLSTTAANSACENSRPIAAPICVNSLAGAPSRSSRAIREACKVAGTATAAEGIIAAQIDECGPLADEKSAPFWKALAMAQRGWVMALTGNSAEAVQAISVAIPTLADDAIDHRASFAFGQPIDGKRSDIGPSQPRWLEFRTIRHDQ
jgi:hypothetical protein